MFKKIFNKKGYISIQVIIIAALLLSLGSWLMFKWSLKSKDMSDTVTDNITKVEDDYRDLIDLENKEDNNEPDINECEKSSSDFEYKNILGNPKTIMITGYTGTDTNVVIPSQIDCKTVVSIDEYAFYPISKDASIGKSTVTLKSVEFPSTLKTIKVSAFEYNHLTSVVLPANIETIDSHAFKNNQLTTITIPKNNNLKSIGYQTFAKNKFTSIDLTSLKNTKLGGNIFELNNISSVKWWDNIEVIPEGIFKDNKFTVIDETVIPLTVKTIRGVAFNSFYSSHTTITKIDLSKHTKLTHIVGLTTLEYTEGGASSQGVGGAFGGQIFVKELILPPNLEHIGKAAFSEVGNSTTNTPLKTIVIPASVDYIDYGAFSTTIGLNNTTKLSPAFNYKFNGTPTTIQEYAFRGLTKVN